jgi:hypothetical protein
MQIPERIRISGLNLISRVLDEYEVVPKSHHLAGNISQSVEIGRDQNVKEFIESMIAVTIITAEFTHAGAFLFYFRFVPKLSDQITLTKVFWAQ